VTEREIIHGCVNGLRQAQQQFVQVYSPYLYGICRRYVCDDFTAQDCLQISLLQVLTHISKYDDSGRFKSWIARITVNKCLEYLRKNSKHRATDLDSIAEPNEASEVLYKLELEDVMRYMSTLPYNSRVAINMYLVEGYSHKEIGEYLGLTESSSRSLVARARKKLVERFDSEKLQVVHKQEAVTPCEGGKAAVKLKNDTL